MTDLSFSIPDDLAGLLQSRIDEGKYANASEYVLELIQRDLEAAADAAWVREKVAEGLASGIVDKDPSDVIEEIIANRRGRRG
ncbi:type II toxin-antitoxin system ParD family antitoxin [Novosphingobium colocasiae]|uniref:ribbon-helix-helix domain-containing protein n=1 Tax=Novosphingobium colocasiae TaxID=1256513 RepID=UPI0035B32E1B